MKLDPQKTAFLTLDLQKRVFGLVPGSERVMPVAAKAVAFARQNQFRIIHVGLGFSEGHPEIPDFESRFCGSNKTSFRQGHSHRGISRRYFSFGRPRDPQAESGGVFGQSSSAGPSIAPRRAPRFFGIATSGIVLSTLRRAFDLDFRSVVLKDACFDADQEVHRVLTEKVFPPQAWVAATDEFIAAQKG